MRLRIEQITAPAVPLITPDLARAHTRIDSAADDALLALYIGSATKTIEGYLGRSLITQTLRQTFAATASPVLTPMVYVPAAVLPIGYQYAAGSLDPRSVDILYGPVQAVTSVAVQHIHDASATMLDPQGYDLDVACDPCRLRLRGGGIDWQSASHVSITYTAGYGPAASAVPLPIIHAALLTVARSYEQRGDTDADGDGLTKPARALLDRYRLVPIGR